MTAASSVTPLIAKAMDIQHLAQTLDVQIVFEGTVRHDNNLLRITSSTAILDMDFRSGLNGSKRNQIYKIFPQSLNELHRRS